MREELLETEAVEVPALEDDAVEVEARPLPAPRTGPLRCASWDGDAQVAVVFADRMDGDDVGVPEPSQRISLGQTMDRELDGHRPVAKRCFGRQEDAGKSPPA